MQKVKLVLQKTGCDNVQLTWVDTAIVEVEIPDKYNLDASNAECATTETWHVMGIATEGKTE